MLSRFEQPNRFVSFGSIAGILLVVHYSAVADMTSICS